MANCVEVVSLYPTSFRSSASSSVALSTPAKSFTSRGRIGCCGKLLRQGQPRRTGTVCIQRDFFHYWKEMSSGSSFTSSEAYGKCDLSCCPHGNAGAEPSVISPAGNTPATHPWWYPKKLAGTTGRECRRRPARQTYDRRGRRKRERRCAACFIQSQSRELLLGPVHITSAALPLLSMCTLTRGPGYSSPPRGWAATLCSFCPSVRIVLPCGSATVGKSGTGCVGIVC
jgi:hypothetical protein